MMLKTVCYMVAVAILLTGYWAFGWWGLPILVGATTLIQFGHKIGTGRWIDWDQ